MKKLSILGTLILSLSACEDVVDISLKDREPILNVDGWLTNTSDTQRITLSYTRPYFDNEAPEPALNATVQVGEAESLQIFNFTDPDNDGTYEWTPEVGQVFGQIGNTYGLQITLSDGSVFQSFSVMDSVPVIDSITFEYNEQAEPFAGEFYYAEFWARDLPGSGNTYWVKSFVNGEFLGAPENINIAYDASFSPGAEGDNKPFIQPIRTSITPPPGERPAPSPFIIGDTLRVELHAVSLDAWFFLFRVQDETIRQPGFAQLFANPLANSPTNIIPADSNDEVVGFFSVAAVSTLEVVMSEENIVDRQPD